MKELINKIFALADDLKPAPAEPAESKLTESVYFDYSEKDNTHFLALLTDALKNAKTFEIHCWNEEKEEILKKGAEFHVQYRKKQNNQKLCSFGNRLRHCRRIFKA